MFAALARGFTGGADAVEDAAAFALAGGDALATAAVPASAPALAVPIGAPVGVTVTAPAAPGDADVGSGVGIEATGALLSAGPLAVRRHTRMNP
ncbi:hypothetical protein BE11_16830, partial [Sorangium cellulosum]